jgi:hypothetical protein
MLDANGKRWVDLLHRQQMEEQDPVTMWKGKRGSLDYSPTSNTKRE